MTTLTRRLNQKQKNREGYRQPDDPLPTGPLSLPVLGQVAVEGHIPERVAPGTSAGFTLQAPNAVPQLESDLVGPLLETSPEFARYWEQWRAAVRWPVSWYVGGAVGETTFNGSCETRFNEEIHLIWLATSDDPALVAHEIGHAVCAEEGMPRACASFDSGALATEICALEHLVINRRMRACGLPAPMGWSAGPEEVQGPRRRLVRDSSGSGQVWLPIPTPSRAGWPPPRFTAAYLRCVMGTASALYVDIGAGEDTAAFDWEWKAWPHFVLDVRQVLAAVLDEDAHGSQPTIAATARMMHRAMVALFPPNSGWAVVSPWTPRRPYTFWSGFYDGSPACQPPRLDDSPRLVAQ